MHAVTWTHLIFDCPCVGQHYGIGQRDDGLWVFAWGRIPWQAELPDEAIYDADDGFALHRRLSTALAVMLKTVDAHGHAWAAEKVREWQARAGRLRAPLTLRVAAPCSSRPSGMALAA